MLGGRRVDAGLLFVVADGGVDLGELHLEVGAQGVEAGEVRRQVGHMFESTGVSGGCHTEGRPWTLGGTVILNLTPHPIRLYSNDREDGIDDLDLHLTKVIPPEAEPARLSTIELGTQGGGIELVEFGHRANVPGKQDGVRYVVSLVVALALVPQGRNDLLVPYREVRNASGTVIGCRQLAQPV